MGFEDAIELVTITSNAIENEEGEPMLRIGSMASRFPTHEKDGRLA